MSGVRASALLVLGVVLLLAALASVAWRQSRAMEGLAEMDQVRRELALEAAERAELERRIQVLESRGRVVPEARDRLGMKTPSSHEIVLLAGGNQ